MKIRLLLGGACLERTKIMSDQLNIVFGIVGFFVGILFGNVPMALFALSSALGWYQYLRHK